MDPMSRGINYLPTKEIHHRAACYPDLLAALKQIQELRYGAEVPKDELRAGLLIANVLATDAIAKARQ